MPPLFKIKVPWWARLIGWWKRRRFEKRDRAEKLKTQRVPVYMGSLFGNTRWRDGKPEPWVHRTHRWDLYETAAGERSFRFIAIGPRCGRNGEDHPQHVLITRWMHGSWDFSWDDLREGKVLGWNR